MPYTAPSRSRSGNTTPDLGTKNTLQPPVSTLDSCQGTLQFQKLLHSQSEAFNMKRSSTSKFYLIDNDNDNDNNGNGNGNTSVDELNKFTIESTQSYSYTPISNNSLSMRLNVLKKSLEILLDNPSWLNSSLDGVPLDKSSSSSINQIPIDQNIKLERNMTSSALQNLLSSTLNNEDSTNSPSASMNSPTTNILDKRSNSISSGSSLNSINDPQLPLDLHSNQTLLNDLRDMLQILDKFQNDDSLQVTQDLEQKMLLLHNLSLSNSAEDSSLERKNILRKKLLNALATPFLENNSNSNYIAGIPLTNTLPSTLGLSFLKGSENTPTISPLSGSPNSQQQQQQQQQQLQRSQPSTRQFHASSNAKTKSPKAVFTVSNESPWDLINANDLGLLMFGFSKNSLSKMKLLDLIAPRSRDLVINRLSRNSEIVFSGEIIAVKRENTTVAWTSLWAKRRDNLIILIFEQVVCETLDFIIERDNSLNSEFYVKEIIKQTPSLYSKSLEGNLLSKFLPTINNKVKRSEIEFDNVDLVSLQDSNIINEIRYFTLLREVGDFVPAAVTSEYLKINENKSLTSDKVKSLLRLNLHSLPYIAGTFIISSKNYEIQSFNEAIATNLFGTNNLKYKSIDKIIPNFSELIKLALLDNPNMEYQDGLVLPEHYFRKLSAQLQSSDESERESLFLKSKGISGLHRDGNRITIDVQLHVQSDNMYFLWITFSRISSDQQKPQPCIKKRSESQFHYHSYDDSTESNSLPSQLKLFDTDPDNQENSADGSNGSAMSRTSSSNTVVNSSPKTPRRNDDNKDVDMEYEVREYVGDKVSTGIQEGLKLRSTKELLLIEETKLQYLKENSPNFPKVIGLEKRTKKFADFKILKNLGQGAYGKVVFAQYKDDELYKDCIKAIFKERILVDTWVRDRKLGTVPSEIQILYALNMYPHANIMRIVDFFEDENCYYLETLQHGSQNAGAVDLYDIIEVKKDMTELEEKYIYFQIAAALAHMHSHGIVHRDIKDENIIVDKDYFVKLIDFGSAAWVKDGPFGVFVGTIDYAAPEVLNGKPYEGKSQDVWAMGVLLYTLVFKENPFCSVDEILDGELKFPPFAHVSPECIDLIKSILITDVNKRPTMQEILDHPWLSGFS